MNGAAKKVTTDITHAKRKISARENFNIRRMEFLSRSPKKIPVMVKRQAVVPIINGLKTKFIVLTDAIAATAAPLPTLSKTLLMTKVLAAL